MAYWWQKEDEEEKKWKAAVKTDSSMEGEKGAGTSGAATPTGDALDMEGDRPNSPQTPEEQNLTMVYYPELSMNPYTAADYTNRTLLPLMYQSLFCVTRSYEAVPILCQTYQISSDMKAYTIHLAPARFSDGTALTAQDVVASLNAAKAGGYYAGRFLHITSVTAEALRHPRSLDFLVKSPLWILFSVICIL